MPSQELSLSHANRIGYETARLPISEHFPERMSAVLNINTVIEVLMAWMVCWIAFMFE